MLERSIISGSLNKRLFNRLSWEKESRGELSKNRGKSEMRRIANGGRS